MSIRRDLVLSQYSGSQFDRVVDNDFSFFTPNAQPVDPIDNLSVNDFFRAYTNLFYDIPTVGEINSHEYLIKQSSQLIAVNDETLVNDFNALVDEINSLREENLELQQQLFASSTGSIDIPTGN